MSVCDDDKRAAIELLWDGELWFEGKLPASWKYFKALRYFYALKFSNIMFQLTLSLDSTNMKRFRCSVIIIISFLKVLLKRGREGEWY